MGYDWNTCPKAVKVFIHLLQRTIKEIIEDHDIGFYIHGSLALGGFHPNQSDIDVLIVMNRPINVEQKRKLATCLLRLSSNPYPIEVSFLHIEQLKNWRHPCRFEFHYSEFWRERFVEDLTNGTSLFLNERIQADPDLAAHITILSHRGICVEGLPIQHVFPLIPIEDYLSAIMADYQECVENIEDNPVYSTLNILRVYLFLRDGKISSKQEAGSWGMEVLPERLKRTVKKAMNRYAGQGADEGFVRDELRIFKDDLSHRISRYV